MVGNYALAYEIPWSTPPTWVVGDPCPRPAWPRPIRTGGLLAPSAASDEVPESALAPRGSTELGPAKAGARKRRPKPGRGSGFRRPSEPSSVGRRPCGQVGVGRPPVCGRCWRPPQASIESMRQLERQTEVWLLMEFVRKSWRGESASLSVPSPLPLRLTLFRLTFSSCSCGRHCYSK